MLKTMIRSTFGALLALLATAAGTAAQDRLAERLDSTTLRAVEALLDRATADGIAAGPLRNKALEGAGKGAAGPAIVHAVEGLYLRMDAAKRALGGKATPDEQVAGAALLDFGVDTVALATLREAAADRSTTSALVGLAFLVQRGVPASRSVPLVRRMLEARATEADFATFQKLVDEDVRAGLPAAGAADARGRAIIRHGASLRSREQPEA